jgi:T-complex protein 1 subunit alpha
MLVDDLGDVNITNDGATILKQLDVTHPAAKVLVELSHLQDQEVGDGTTSVVLIAAQLLKHANELIKMGVHPTSVINGYNIAKRLSCDYLKKNMVHSVSSLHEDTVLNVARTTISSKIIGHDGDYFATMAVNAVKAIEQISPITGKKKYPISQVNILKAHGKSAKESELVDGFALNCTRASQQMPTVVQNAKIALLDIDLRKTRLAMGVQVVVNDPLKLEAIREKENSLTRDRIQLLIDAGANVVFTTKGIDDMALKTFVENKMIAVRRCKKTDLQAVAQATGGKLIVSLADDEDNESFDPSWLGQADEVAETKVGYGELIYVRGTKSRRAQSIILRGANDYMLDEIDRSLHDAMCAVKRCLESNKVTPGGGACEAALHLYLQDYSRTLDSKDQLAVEAFADALLTIPKNLAINAAYDATELIAQLRANHSLESGEGKYFGLDLENNGVRDNLIAGVLEPAMSKIKSLRFATEAAITILRIDDSINMTKKDDPNRPAHDHY